MPVTPETDLMLAGDEGRKLFEVLYQGFVLASTNQPRSIETIMQEAALLRKLKAVSVEQQTVEGGVPTRTIVGDVTLSLSRQERDMLRTYIATVPWRVHTVDVVADLLILLA